MKRIMSMVVALGLAVTACSSSDEPAATPTTEAAEESSAENDETTSDETTADASADEQSDDVTADDTTSEQTDEASDDGADEASDDMTSEDSDEMTDDDDADSIPIRSIEDVPVECREEMATFLRAIEPIVSSLDWKTASLADFEAITSEFEDLAGEFDDVSEASGCGNLDFDDEDGSKVLIEFAKQEAPGAVAYLEFLDVLLTGAPSNDGGSADGQINTCADGVAFIQGLMDDYDTFADVPATELLKIPQLAVVYGTCTPEQLAFFDSGDVIAFLEG